MNRIEVSSSWPLKVAVASAWLLAAARVEAADKLTIKSVTLDPPTLHALGVQALIAGDDDYDAGATVRYRAVGAAAWREGPPLWRVRSETVVGFASKPQLAGSIFDLQPDTAYEIEIHFVDPDGLDETRTLTGRTRPVPRAEPKTPRAVAVKTAAELKTALGAAKAGDVITLADGKYAGPFYLGASGTSDDPIVLRGAGQNGTVLDGGGCEGCNVLEVNGSHVHVERMTLQAGLKGLAFLAGAVTGGVARRLTVRDVVHGISAQHGEVRELFICDNVIEGRLVWPWIFDPTAHDHWDDRGVSVDGDGVVVCHNRISGFGDPMIQRKKGARSFDFYGNDVSESWDGAELEPGEGNARLWGNRWTNVSAAISIQPIYGGPAYVLRNAVMNATNEQFKLHPVITTEAEEPSGILAYHNTFVSPTIALNLQTPATVHNFAFANNLFVGPKAPDAKVVEWTSKIDHGSFDHDGYFPDGVFWLGVVSGNNVFASSFADFQKLGIFEKNGVLLSEPIFASGMVGPADAMAKAAVPASFALAASSNAVDKGVALSGINGGFRGKAPDLGAWEIGCPAPIYGPRPERMDSYAPPVDCSPGGGGSSDAGESGGSGGSGDAAAGSGGRSGQGSQANDAAGGAGCGCRTGAPAGHASWPVVLAALLPIARRRRQSTRVKAHGRVEVGWSPASPPIVRRLQTSLAVAANRKGLLARRGYDRGMRASPLLVLALSLAAACGSESSGYDDGASSGGGASGGGASSSGASSGFGGDGGPGSSSGGNTPEICDGVDNDGNGIIDDVDKGGDGICDCLRIATLGVPGKWGSGNVFAQWLKARSDFGATSLGDKVLTKELLDGFEVIVAQDLSTMTRSYAPAEVTALADWVKAGGGFMTLIGYGSPPERTNVNTLLAAFSMSYGAQAILERKGVSTVPVSGWDPHPVTNGVTKVGVDNGYPVTGSGTVIGREGGYEVLRVQEIGPGHILMWGDEWITYDSEWSGHPDYQVERFWLNAIKWLTPAKKCQVALPPVK